MADKNAFLTNIRPEIQETLATRQDSSFRSKSTWFKDRTPWIRMSSMVSVGGDADIRKQWILFSGTSSVNSDNKLVIKEKFQDIYKFNNNQYQRPFPGITNLHIENKSSYGSVREATISFSCWTLDQLEMLEKLYMSLGMPILTEWGWGTDLNGIPITENLALEDPREISFYCIDKKIKKLVNKWKGHYDAMIGLVTDFSWSLTSDGGFECSSTIISPGDMYLSMGTRTTSKQIYKKDDNTGTYTASENLESAIFNFVKDFNYLVDEDLKKQNDIGPANVGLYG